MAPAWHGGCRQAARLCAAFAVLPRRAPTDEIAIAEHETSARGGDATGSPNTIGIWHVMVAWPVRLESARTDPGDLWPRGGQLARDGEWAAWRLRGNLTPANLESLLAHLPEARRRFESRQL